jgi:hypothetical protein
MPSENDREEAVELLLAPAARARLFRKRAAALEVELAATDLPRLREKLRVAADRFLQLADSEERRAAGAEGNDEDRTAKQMHIAEVLGPLAVFLNRPSRGS